MKEARSLVFLEPQKEFLKLRAEDDEIFPVENKTKDQLQSFTYLGFELFY